MVLRCVILELLVAYNDMLLRSALSVGEGCCEFQRCCCSWLRWLFQSFVWWWILDVMMELNGRHYFPNWEDNVIVAVVNFADYGSRYCLLRLKFSFWRLPLAIGDWWLTIDEWRLIIDDWWFTTDGWLLMDDVHYFRWSFMVSGNKWVNNWWWVYHAQWTMLNGIDE